MSVKITVYGGAGEIGGNKINIIDEKKKLNFWADFGMSFKRHGQFFSEFVQPRKSAGMTDLIRTGIIPKTKGIYRQDFVEKSGHRYPKRPASDAVFQSHAHYDHIACTSHLRPDIQFIMSPESYYIQRALQESGQSRFEDFIVLKEYYYGRLKDRIEIERPIRQVENQQVFKLKNRMKVEAWRVDHSLPGAMAYIFHTSAGPIVFTGDFRLHGHHKEWTKEFIERVKEIQPYAVIGEGTNIDEPRGITENQVFERISGEIKKADGLVAANWPVRDFDRLISFYRAAKENGRKLAISLKQAYILKLLWENHRDEALTIKGHYLGHGKYQEVCPINKSIEDRTINTKFSPKLDDLLGEDIVIFVPQKRHGRILEDATLENVLKDYSIWERDFIAENLADEKHPIPLDTTYRRKKGGKEKIVFRKNIWVNADTIRNHQKDFVVFIDNYAVQNLIDFRPKKGSIAIYSKTEPFDLEMEIDFERICNWYKEFDLPIVQAHCSGHTGGSQSIKIYQEMNPKHFISIHTEHPEMFQKPLGNKGINVIIPDDSYPLEKRKSIEL